jgi:hypothetical protein
VGEEGMSDSEIRELWLQANGRITELLILVMALQTLLQQAGIFSQDDVDDRVAQLQKLYDERFRHHLAEAQEKQVHEQLRQLLEAFEGTKQ